MSEYRPTVLVDLDGVLAKYEQWEGIDHFGDPIPGARDFLKELIEDYEVVIYSTRCNAPLNSGDLTLREKMTAEQSLKMRVEDWLKKNDMPYDRIETGKPLAVAIIDDRAISCEPQEDLRSFKFAKERLKKKIDIQE